MGGVNYFKVYLLCKYDMTDDMKKIDLCVDVTCVN
jgi:hypothetical protein